MALVDDLKPVYDELLGLYEDFGHAPYQVWVRTHTYAGPRPGKGEEAYEDTPITVANGKRPQVRQVSDRDVVAGTSSVQRFEIGPLVPTHADGGVAPATLEPPVTVAGRVVHYLLKGPGLPASGMLCKKVSDRLDSPFEYFVTVETIGKAG
jgi:hypothetical protein